jgi:ectoine hydroxylase-related dioxygenase (phytanoyl-CoA dioxygenase family)
VAGQGSGDLATTFDRDGVVCVRNLISAEWVERLREAVEIVIAEARDGADRAASAGKEGRFIAQSSLWLRYPVFREFIFSSDLGELGARMLRSNEVRLFNDSTFVKEPGTDVRSQWHQDLPYLRIDGMQTSSAWIALDEVTADSGAVQFVAGSHKWDRLFVPVEFGSEAERDVRDADGMTRIPDIDANRDKYRIVSFDLQPGDATFHNLRIVHGAGGNASPDRRRRAFSVRMCGDDIRGYDRKVGKSPADTTITPGEPLGNDAFLLLWPRVSALV